MTDVENPADPPVTPLVDVPLRQKMPIVIIGLCIVLVLLIGAYWMLPNMNTFDEKTATGLELLQQAEKSLAKKDVETADHYTNLALNVFIRQSDRGNALAAIALQARIAEADSDKTAAENKLRIKIWKQRLGKTY
jgi:hypothetical protein